VILGVNPIVGLLFLFEGSTDPDLSIYEGFTIFKEIQGINDVMSNYDGKTIEGIIKAVPKGS
jgi:hypothetical protein